MHRYSSAATKNHSESVGERADREQLENMSRTGAEVGQRYDDTAESELLLNRDGRRWRRL